MSAVRDCLELTEKLFQLVIRQPADRDQTLALIEELLEQRQTVIKTIHPPFTQEEQQLGQEIVKRNAVIDVRLEKLKAAIQKDIQDVTKKKDSVDKYVNPYAAMQLDGVFYDKKN